MTIPGFTADLSLPAAKQSYRGRSQYNKDPYRAVIQQFCPCGDGTLTCCVGNDDCNVMFSVLGDCLANGQKTTLL
jgi:hypothetical protein